MSRPPWEIANELGTSRERIVLDSITKKDIRKDRFIVNRTFSLSRDTILLANEMNIRNHVDEQSYVDFFQHVLPRKKRFFKWYKKTNSDDLKIIVEYYNCSYTKGMEILSILSKDQIEELRKSLEKGG